ncbi:MAG TPA: Gfo/Idh/MocA family oxidoreductase [Streptosporangiaceae bacterium]|jgi:predicted dehydrogenase
MTSTEPVRWGVLGTANIARSAFLPALRQAGGEPVAVAGRDATRAGEYASVNGIGRAITGYQPLLDDPAIDAVYIALPNALHAEWTISALQAGKAVLCEKPLCGTLADTERVLTVAMDTGALLWEAFVFPFQPQMQRIRELIAAGAIGEVGEIKSNFHFALAGGPNIRLSRELEGGALLDVGCYPVRLAQELFGPQHAGAWARAVMGGDGVDVDTWGVLDYPDGQRLMLSCGMRRRFDTATSIEGTGGRITVTNPFHPGPADAYTVEAGPTQTRTMAAPPGEMSFTAAIRHIHAAIRGEERPRHLAIETSLATALALHDLAASLAASADR